MPGIALHCFLASRVLEEWRASRRRSPFGLHEPRAVDAFLQGAIGPDMGYFARGAAWISDLAHHESTAELARALVRAARTSEERAYAWGWVTHHLADAAVHPLVNRASAELAGGGGSLSPGEDPTTHLRVELGLDAYVQHRYRAGRALSASPALTGRGIGFLARAFRRTYGRAVPARALLGAHVTLAALAPWIVVLTGVVAREHDFARSWAGRLTSPLRDGPVRRPSKRAEAQWTGALTAVPPTPALLRGLGRVARGFARDFFAHHASGLAHLPNLDLDTGFPPADAHARLWREVDLRILVP